eukprot:327601_1
MLSTHHQPHYRGDSDQYSIQSSSSFSLLSQTSTDNIIIPSANTYNTRIKYLHCRKCLLQFASRKQLYLHIRNFHWYKFKCNICNGQFSSDQLLTNHKVNMHNNNNNKYKCKFCRKYFIKKKK